MRGAVTRTHHRPSLRGLIALAYGLALVILSPWHLASCGQHESSPERISMGGDHGSPSDCMVCIASCASHDRTAGADRPWDETSAWVAAIAAEVRATSDAPRGQATRAPPRG